MNSSHFQKSYRVNDSVPGCSEPLNFSVCSKTRLGFGLEILEKQGLLRARVEIGLPVGPTLSIDH